MDALFSPQMGGGMARYGDVPASALARVENLFADRVTLRIYGDITHLDHMRWYAEGLEVP